MNYISNLNYLAVVWIIKLTKPSLLKILLLLQDIEYNLQQVEKELYFPVTLNQKEKKKSSGKRRKKT